MTYAVKTGERALGEIPSGVRPSADAVRAARGRVSELRRVVEQSRIPMVIVDNKRRYLEVNRSALLFFRRSLTEMRRLRVDDFTRPDRLGMLETVWRQMMETGCVAGTGQAATPDGGRFDTGYWGMANVLPGKHVFAFALGLARVGDEPTGPGDRETAPFSPLTPRELDLLQLAAHGLSGPKIAERLVLSRSTVRTHFENIYEKLGVGDRAGAVAKAMRLGLIE
ncbi:MAG: LuxR C-terminal-related transcriptional regulator [Solirubrobacterales bacterium]